MNPSLKPLCPVLLLAALALSACGGGGGGGMTASNQTTPEQMETPDPGPGGDMGTDPESDSAMPGDGSDSASPDPGHQPGPASVRQTSFGDRQVKALPSGLSYDPLQAVYVGINGDDAAPIRHVSAPVSAQTGRFVVDDGVSSASLAIRNKGNVGTVVLSDTELPSDGITFSSQFSPEARIQVSGLTIKGRRDQGEGYPKSEFLGWTQGYQAQARGGLHYKEGHRAGNIGENGTFYLTRIGIIGGQYDFGSSRKIPFLAWGYWLTTTGGTRHDIRAGNSGTIQAKAGAFIGGTHFAENGRPSGWREAAGTASYSGESQGFFHQQYGPGEEFGEFASAVELGEYVQPLSVDVNFANGELTLCGGCEGTTTISVDGRKSDGTYYRYSGPASSFFRYEAHTDTVEDSGSFTISRFGSDDILTGTHPNSSLEDLGYHGKIKGVFSRRMDDEGRPVMVIGTTQFDYRYQDGTHGYAIGTFGAKVDP